MEPNKLPEGRKPLPDEWFAERAQVQERIKELEANLAKAVEALEFYADKDSWISAQPYESAAADVDTGDIARTTLAKLKGQDDD